MTLRGGELPPSVDYLEGGDGMLRFATRRFLAISNLEEAADPEGSSLQLPFIKTPNGYIQTHPPAR